MTQPLPKCAPDCTTYRIERDRSPEPASWTKSELLAELRKLQADLDRAERRDVAMQRQVSIMHRRLAKIPRWVRWLFGDRS